MNQEEEFNGKHSQLTEKIIGSFYAVSNELGFGFLETVYRRAMMIALREAGLQADEEVPIPVFFRGQPVGTYYADILVEKCVVLELKTSDEFNKDFTLQLLHYLRSTPIEVGLLLLFGKRAHFRRVIMENERKRLIHAPPGF